MEVPKFQHLSFPEWATSPFWEEYGAEIIRFIEKHDGLYYNLESMDINRDTKDSPIHEWSRQVFVEFDGEQWTVMHQSGEVEREEFEGGRMEYDWSTGEHYLVNDLGIEVDPDYFSDFGEIIWTDRLKFTATTFDEIDLSGCILNRSDIEAVLEDALKEQVAAERFARHLKESPEFPKLKAFLQSFC